MINEIRIMKNRSSSGKMCEMTNPGKVYPTVKITKVEERRAVGIFSCGCKSGQEWPNLRVKLVSFPDFHQVSLCEREIEKFLLCRFLTALQLRCCSCKHFY